MADIIDADGRITIPGFYDDVEEVSPAEREMIAQIPFDEAKYKAAIGVDALSGEKVIRRWKETVAVRRSIFVVSGAVIRKRAVKQCFRPKPMQSILPPGSASGAFQNIKNV